MKLKEGCFVILLFWYTQKSEYLADEYLVTFDTAVRDIVSFFSYQCVKSWHALDQLKHFQVNQSNIVVIQAQELKANYLDLITSGQDTSFNGEWWEYQTW